MGKVFQSRRTASEAAGSFCLRLEALGSLLRRWPCLFPQMKAGCYLKDGLWKGMASCTAVLSGRCTGSGDSCKEFGATRMGRMKRTVCWSCSLMTAVAAAAAAVENCYFLMLQACRWNPEKTGKSLLGQEWIGSTTTPHCCCCHSKLEDGQLSAAAVCQHC